ncbi:hypothetical protein L2520_08290 [Limosilactobacillus vaginalis]|uniref:Uncharacterized protein n=1 Tax=Limosilactobacillus vaginalis TaxID=1633 RepID=A0ABT4K8Z5_9LACO|nr:hypothetical protein [Limosilactobacillus vaginalis]MCZ3747386.1 hypothetical protein [Limosilactobacillus vaginalis]MCZ3752369.1 hypothetical protein [Limosilactobacillus vaginalis]MCZ3754111.1 hypothetical protein [Limosilactobacillus vaginalis]MCZ3755794.1 hypothetical protein [Limosilactobacillus vaginalis]MCZ3757557.1 hypothetical protein [Limosilactobacillus vaginalis]
MDKKDEIKAIIHHPEYMLSAESKSLKQRIKERKLGGEEVKSAVATTAKDKGKSLVSDLLNAKWFDFVCDIADTGDKLKSKLDDAKKIQLLSEYLQKTDNHEKALNSLIDLITNPYGLSLYSKIISILSDSPTDGDILEILSDYLINLTEEENLQDVFSRNKTILTLIDKCSPQALILLRMYNKWVLVPRPQTVISNGGHVQGDNTQLVAQTFVENKVIENVDVDDMQMAIYDLEENGLAEFISGTLNSAPDKTVFAERPTKLGEMVKDAISNNR